MFDQTKATLNEVKMVSIGFKTADGQPLDRETVATIAMRWGMLGVTSYGASFYQHVEALTEHDDNCFSITTPNLWTKQHIDIFITKLNHDYGLVGDEAIEFIIVTHEPNTVNLFEMPSPYAVRDENVKMEEKYNWALDAQYDDYFQDFDNGAMLSDTEREVFGDNGENAWWL